MPCEFADTAKFLLCVCVCACACFFNHWQERAHNRDTRFPHNGAAATVPGVALRVTLASCL